MEGEGEEEEGANVEVVRRGGGKRIDGAVRVTIQDDLTDSQQSPGKYWNRIASYTQNRSFFYEEGSTIEM